MATATRDNEFAQLIYDHTRAHTSGEFTEWMATLPTERRLSISGVELHLVHGSTVALNDFWWDSHVWYAVLDLADSNACAKLVALDYDWQAQADSMTAAGLPRPFAETIETGWWTTCLEILPPCERSTGRYHLYRSSLPEAFALPMTLERFTDDHQRRSVAGDPAVRLALLPGPVVDLHQLSLQPGLRLLRGGLLTPGAGTQPVPRAVPGPGRGGCRGRIH